MHDAGILTVLAELTPWDPVAGAAVTLRSTNRDDARACLLNSQMWWPVMTRAPRLERRLFDGNFSGQLASSAGDFALSFDAFPDAMRYEWAERPAKLWIGRLGDAFGSYTLLFEGVMTGVTGEGGAAAVGLRVNDGWMDGPLLTASYAGTGGAEGMAALKGQPKPLSIGAPRYAEGVLIDDVNCVYQLHGYGAMEGVEFALDSLVRFPAAAGNDASYAALVAASIAPGTVRTSLAAGLVRHGAPVAGVASYLLKGDNTGGWHRRPGAVITRLAGIGGASGGQIDSTSMTALDTAVAYDISLFLAEQVSVRGAVQEIAASCNAAAGVNWLGKLVVAKVGIAGTADLTLKPDGTALPPCGLPARLPVDSPFHRMRMSAVHAQRPHGPDEIAFTAQIVPAVTYDDAATYREGHMVIQPTNGITYLYINPSPTAGNDPPNVTYWQAVSGPPNWSVIGDDGGKPENGATKNAPGQMLRDASYSAAEWSLTMGAVRRTSSYVSSVWPTSHAVELTCTLAGNVEAVPYSADLGTGLVPLNGASRVWLRAYTRNAAATRSQVWVMNFYDQAGTPIDSVSRIITVSDIPSGAGGWVELRGVVPDGAAFVVPKLQVPAGTPGTGVWYTANPLLAFVQPSADVTQEGNAAGLLAGSKILQNGAPAIQAGASPFEYSVTDGDVITFQPPLAVTPKESFNLLGLPALASGESYSARAETLTGSGCTVRIKKRTSGGTISTLSTGAGSVITTDLEYQVSKGDSRDARDFKYNMRLQGDIYGLYQAGGGGGWLDIPFMLGGITIEIFAKVSGSWQSCGVFTVTPPYGSTGTFSFDKTFTFTCANAIGDPSGNEFRALVLSRAFPATDKLTALHSVAWQIDGTSVTETAVTQAVTMRIQPQNV